jgi:hypothetical protein
MIDASSAPLASWLSLEPDVLSHNCQLTILYAYRTATYGK